MNLMNILRFSVCLSHLVQLLLHHMRDTSSCSVGLGKHRKLIEGLKAGRVKRGFWALERSMEFRRDKSYAMLCLLKVCLDAKGIGQGFPSMSI